MHRAESDHAIPDPLDADDGDVAFAIASAQARWTQGFHVDAITWLHRAVDAALEVRHDERAREIRSIAEQLSSKLGPSYADVHAEGHDDRDSASRLMTLIEDALVDSGVHQTAPSASLELHGIRVDHVRGWERLTTGALQRLRELARVETRAVDEELTSFALALVVEGSVSVMLAIADCPVTLAAAGDPIFTAGTLRRVAALRLVAREHGTKLVVWSEDDIDAALADCPSVIDDFRKYADRLQALAGAGMGLLGDRLDDTTQSLVMERLEVRSYAPGEVIVEEGTPLSGMHIVGAGQVELVQAADDSASRERLMLGDFVLPSQILEKRAAPMTVRSGAVGALVLSCDDATAQELLGTIPALSELVSSFRE